jgi:hypothetical protein
MMNQSACRQCGAELVPQTNFCRKCGAGIEPGANELPTALFEPDLVATQRLDSRPTAPNAFVQPTKTPGSNRLILVGVVSLLVLAAIVSTVAVVKNRSRGRVAVANAVLYPGSRTTMDISAGGGRAVSLETTDSFEQVTEWYQAKLKPEKIVQLTEKSVVMKGESATVTIVGDDNHTSILLKIIP